MTDQSNLLDLPIRNNIKTYENLKQIATDQGLNYATGFCHFW